MPASSRSSLRNAPCFLSLDLRFARARRLALHAARDREFTRSRSRPEMSKITQQPVHNEAQTRFEVTIAGKLSRADYRLDDGVMHMFHTEVPVQQEGRGIAAMLVRAAFEYARAHGYKVRPA